MTEGSASEEILSFMKSLSEKFDALREDVNRLKTDSGKRPAQDSTRDSEREQRRSSASRSGDSSESDANSDSHRPQSRQWKKETSRSRRSRKGKQRRRTSRSCSRSRSRDRPRQSPGRNRSRLWGTRMSQGEEPIDLTKPITFPDSDEEDQSDARLAEVSEKTKKLLEDSCTRRLQNSSRVKKRSHYPLPKVAATRTPQLEAFLRPEVSNAAKAAIKTWLKCRPLSSMH